MTRLGREIAVVRARSGSDRYTFPIALVLVLCFWCAQAGMAGTPPGLRHGREFSELPKATQLFEKELQFAQKARTRDARIKHLRNALKHRPGHPENLAAEYRIGILLSQHYDPNNPQPPRREEAARVFDHILRTYKHMDYYRKDPTNSSSDLQFMIPKAAIHRANLTFDPNGHEKIRQWLYFSMKCMAETHERRVKDWTNEPAPPEVRLDDPLGGQLERAKWKSRMHLWEQRRKRAAEGNVFSKSEMAIVEVAVRLYRSLYRRRMPGKVKELTEQIVRDFPGTPMAKVAQWHIH